MSSFSTLNTALSGLQAHKRVIDVIGHNISNVNTEGYSRRQVLLEPASGMKIASRFDTDFSWNNSSTRSSSWYGFSLRTSSSHGL